MSKMRTECIYDYWIPAQKLPEMDIYGNVSRTVLYSQPINEDCFENLELNFNPPPSFPPSFPPSSPPSVPDFFNDCDLCFEHVRNEFASGF